MSHLPIAYPGNKRQDIQFFVDYLPKDFDIYCEPFGGTFALGYYLYTKKYDIKKYIYNDNEPKIVEALKLIRDNEYKDIDKKKLNICDQYTRYQHDKKWKISKKQKDFKQFLSNF